MTKALVPIPGHADWTALGAQPSTEAALRAHLPLRMSSVLGCMDAENGASRPNPGLNEAR